MKGKRNKKDVQEFQFRLMDNIISLHADLKNKTYKHGGYRAFNISDPKPRNIHKASVRDFVIFSQDKRWLESIISEIKNFLWHKLKLTLHPDKVYIKTLVSGVDFLGWVNFSDHRVLRTTTKRRMFKKLGVDKRPEVVNSYLGLLGHGNTKKLQAQMI